MSATQTVWVELGERRYPVVVGDGVIGRIHEFLPPDAKRVAVVTQSGIDVDLPVERKVSTHVLKPGEQAKNMATVEELCIEWSQKGLTRADVVVSVGGGVVSDVAGYAAAAYHRGVAVIHVPTTLLAQVDAAIGGKTGVNLPTGKNLVGAFWQPSAVICDVATLASLPERELLSGYGEMAKYHFLGANLLTCRDDLVESVARSVAVKAEFVARDEFEVARKERGGRALLNYGHTLAHALESLGAYELRHGEAVAIGLKYAAVLAHRMGRINSERVADHDAILDAYGLGDRIPGTVDHDAVIAAMLRDKKSHGELTFVLDGPAGLELVDSVPEEQVRLALDEMGK